MGKVLYMIYQEQLNLLGMTFGSWDDLDERTQSSWRALAQAIDFEPFDDWLEFLQINAAGDAAPTGG